MSLNNDQKVQIAGAVAVIVGACLPAYSAPVIGGISLVYRGEGWIVILACVAAIILSYKSKTQSADYCLLTSLLICGVSAYAFATMKADLQTKAAADLNGNPFQGLSDAIFASIGFSWAWIVILLGHAAALLSKKIADDFL